MTYKEAMEYISSVGKFGSNLGLKRTLRLLELLGNPQEKVKFIHVAGTNGKGSTTAMISKVLMGMGYKVGMYTSPYLEEFEERIQINRINIPKDELVKLLSEVKNAVKKVIDEGYDHPTEFEIITAMMFLYFKNEKVDYGVIEVGLGGRFDSTNVIKPILSVITSISMDHMKILGDTIEKIAFEKAGIIKENVPVILYPQEKGAEDVVLNEADKKKAKVYMVNEDDGRLIAINHKNYYQEVQVRGLLNTYHVKLPLLGEHQIKNLAAAIKAIEVFSVRENINLDKEKVEESLRDVKWIGRLEVLNDKPLVVIDGAHNIQGITCLSKNINKYFKYKKLYLLLGILADKQVDEMIRVITPNAEEVCALTPNNDRAEGAEELKKEIEKYNSHVYAMDDYESAFLEVLKRATAEDCILVSGSLYMIGDMRKIINRILK